MQIRPHKPVSKIIIIMKLFLITSAFLNKVTDNTAAVKMMLVFIVEPQ